MSETQAVLERLDSVRAETLKRLVPLTRVQLDWRPPGGAGGEAAWSLGRSGVFQSRSVGPLPATIATARNGPGAERLEQRVIDDGRAKVPGDFRAFSERILSSHDCIRGFNNSDRGAQVACKIPIELPDHAVGAECPINAPSNCDGADRMLLQPAALDNPGSGCAATYFPPSCARPSTAHRSLGITSAVQPRVLSGKLAHIGNTMSIRRATRRYGNSCNVPWPLASLATNHRVRLCDRSCRTSSCRNSIAFRRPCQKPRDY